MSPVAVSSQSKKSRSRYFWMLWVLPLLSAIGTIGAHLTFAPNYTAEANMIVMLGREYLYRESSGGSQFNLWRQEVAMNAELEILNRNELRQQIVNVIGAQRLLDDEIEVDGELTTIGAIKVSIKEFLRGNGLMDAKVSANSRAIELLDEKMTFTSVKNSNIVHLEFTHADSTVARETLEAVVRLYLDTRLDFFGPPSLATLESLQRQYLQHFEGAEAALTSYKNENQISDIDAQLTSVLQRSSAVEAEGLRLELALNEAIGRQSVSNASLQLGGSRINDLELNIGGLKNSLTKLDEQRKRLREDYARLDGQRLIVREKTTAVDAARKRLDDLGQTIEEVRVTAALSHAGWTNVRLLQKPYVPERVGISLFSRLGLALLIGLVLAIGLVVGLNVWVRSGLGDLLQVMRRRVEEKLQAGTETA